MFNLNPFRDTPYALQFVFVGKMYQWQYNSGFITGITNIQIKASTDQIPHIIARTMRTASTGITVKLIEAPTFTSTGNVVVSSFSVNREIPTAPKLIFAANSSANSGSTIENVNLVSGNTWEQIAPEIILKSGENYNIRVINTGSTALKVDFNFVYYESNN